MDSGVFRHDRIEFARELVVADGVGRATVE
jgi:hypothetical protein